MEASATQLEVTPAQHTPIPAFSLSRQYENIQTELQAAVNRVLCTPHFIRGPELEQFETEAAHYLGVNAVVGCASGTDALWLALESVNLRPGDAVLTTPFSFFASASSIVRCGAKPIFADIDPATLNLSPESARTVLKASPDKARAIVPVHLYGQCADMRAFDELEGEFGATIVEDAAQALERSGMAGMREHSEKPQPSASIPRKTWVVLATVDC